MSCSPEGLIEIKGRQCVDGEWVENWFSLNELDSGPIDPLTGKTTNKLDDPFIKIGYGIGLALQDSCKCTPKEPVTKN